MSVISNNTAETTAVDVITLVSTQAVGLRGTRVDGNDGSNFCPWMLSSMLSSAQAFQSAPLTGFDRVKRLASRAHCPHIPTQPTVMIQSVFTRATNSVNSRDTNITNITNKDFAMYTGGRLRRRIEVSPH